jgi:hypothetical protein
MYSELTCLSYLLEIYLYELTHELYVKKIVQVKGWWW